jgi:hypothetical protein
VITDIEHLRKPGKKSKGDGLDMAVHDFAVIVMARVLEQEFQPAYIFANHRNWENGPWKNGSDHPIPDVALGEQETQHLFAVYEIETNHSLLNMDQILSRLKLLGEIHIELVLPQSRLEEVKKELQHIPIQGFWTYTIDKNWKLTVRKDSESKSQILKSEELSGDIIV